MTAEQENQIMVLERRALQAEAQTARTFIELCTLRIQLLDQRIQQMRNTPEVKND
jgi:hypothetical protein